MMEVAGIGFTVPPRNSAIDLSAIFAATSHAARSTIESARSPTPALCEPYVRPFVVLNVASRSAMSVPT